jgi:hypothetical protein
MLRVIGAGLPRTGTFTLKTVLERLLGGPCHHMAEVFGNEDRHVPPFLAAANGDLPDWDTVFDGYVAAVDWPASAFWRDPVGHYPDAVVILSQRDSPSQWWTSVSATVLQVIQNPGDGMREDWSAMVNLLWSNFLGGAEPTEANVQAAYERHLAAVREAVPADRLLEFNPKQGWEPLCAALDIPVPDEPFPHLNTTEQFHAGMQDPK